MAEWSNAAVLKTAEPETAPGVRIPLLPPLQTFIAILSWGVDHRHLRQKVDQIHSHWNLPLLPQANSPLRLYLVGGHEFH